MWLQECLPAQNSHGDRPWAPAFNSTISGGNNLKKLQSVVQNTNKIFFKFKQILIIPFLLHEFTKNIKISASSIVFPP